MTTETHVAHLLPAFVAGTLAPDDTHEVRAHLPHCAACRAEVAAWEAIGQITRDRHGGAADRAIPVRPRAMRPAADDALRFPLMPLTNTQGTGVAAGPVTPARMARRSGVVLATTALVLLTLVSALVMGNVRRGRDTPLVSLLALEALAPLPDGDPATMQGVLTTVTVPALPAKADVIEIARWTFPAATAPITTLPSTGPVLLYVTQGSLTVSLDDGAGAILTGRTGTPMPVTLSLEQQVRAGQTLVIPREARATLANPDSTATMVIAVDILEGVVADWVVPWDQEAIAVESLVTSTGSFASGPARLTLSRKTLAAGDALPAPPSGTYQLVAAESTYLGYLARPADGTVINREPDALGVLILTAGPP